MKNIAFSFVVISVSLFAKGQWLPLDSAYKAFINKDTFEIKYVFNRAAYFEPSVAIFKCDSNGRNCHEDTEAYVESRHYFSTIFVYQIILGKKKAIGIPMQGYYVKAGCFEDVPERWVQEAFNSVKPKK